jgi:hypothetical protein
MDDNRACHIHSQRQRSRLVINRSARKVNSANFALTAFSEVRVARRGVYTFSGSALPPSVVGAI